MAQIRPKDLPAGTPNGSAAIIFDNGVTVEKATPLGMVDAATPLASQPQAEAGVDNVNRMSPLRVKQAIDAQAVSLSVLAASSGSSSVGFIQNGSGAVARTTQSKVRDRVSVKDFGAVGDGVTNDRAAFQAAIDAMNAIGGGEVFIPHGAYAIGSGLTMRKHVTVRGASMNGVVLKPTFSGNLFNMDLTAEMPPSPPLSALFVLADVAWDNFTIDCGTQTGVVGMAMKCCTLSSITNVCFKGCLRNAYIDRGRAHTIQSIWITGTTTVPGGGFTLTSTDDTAYVFEVHMSDIHFLSNYVVGFVDTMILIRRGALCELSSISVNDGWKYHSTNTSNFLIMENDCQGCSVSDCVVAAVSYGILLRNGGGVAGAPGWCHFTNVDIDQAYTAALRLQEGCFYNVFTGCKFSSSGANTTLTAVVVSSGDTGNQFIGCQVDKYDGVGGTAFNLTGTNGTMVHDCLISRCTNGVVFGASNVNVSVHNNQFNIITTPVSGSIAGVGNSVKNNTGYKLAVNLASGVPATTVPVTNNTGFAVTAYITGGTVTVVSINGIFAGPTSGGFRLEPGDSIAITHTVAPTWTWVPSWG